MHVRNVCVYSVMRRAVRKSAAQPLFVFRFNRAAGYDHRRDVIIRVLALSLFTIRIYLSKIWSQRSSIHDAKMHSIAILLIVRREIIRNFPLMNEGAIFTQVKRIGGDKGLNWPVVFVINN